MNVTLKMTIADLRRFNKAVSDIVHQENTPKAATNG